MAKKAISLTLDERNLLWLRGRTTALGRGSLSETVDQLINEARAGRLGTPAPSRSVVGTIDIAADDPDLDRADEIVRELFATSLSRPFLVRESKRGRRSSPRGGRRGSRG